MKKNKKETKIIKVQQNDLTNFEIGQIETCNFILDNLKRELQRLRNFELDDILKYGEDPMYVTKYLTTLKLNQFFYDQVANYKQQILNQGANK